jgi:Ser-tRNA(Ala) deacylase AlaX
LSCSFLLCLGLTNAVQADENVPSSSDVMKTYSQTDKHGFNERPGMESEGARTIKGEVLRVEGEHYLVKGNDGKEVRMHIDPTTQMSERNFKQGDLIEAKVNNENHALSIRSSDRRSDHTLQPGPADSADSMRQK